MKRIMDRLRPPARPRQRTTAATARDELLEAAYDCDAAALAFLLVLERRREAVAAAVKAGVVTSTLGARALQRRAVDQAVAAIGLPEYLTADPVSPSARRSFTEEAQQLLGFSSPPSD